MVDESPQNFRSQELDNVAFLLDLLYEHAIRDKWNPDISDSEGHQLAVRFFYDKVFDVYAPILVRALRHSHEQKMDKAIGEKEALCYRERFDDAIEERFDRIFRRLIQHGVWAIPVYKETFRATTSKPIEELFQKEGLDYIYLTKIE